MATSNLTDYVQQVAKAIDHREGIKCSELISFSHSHIANARLRVEAPEAICSRFMGPPFDEMTAAHVKTIWASSKQKHDEAWQYQNMCVQEEVLTHDAVNIFNSLKSFFIFIPQSKTV